MFTLKTFYKSKEWLTLLRVLKTERLSDDGLLLCEHCGEPIVKSYDCIGHHKIALTESNVNDYDISLNSDNIMLIHHRCHNKIHERFGFERPKQVYLVYGAPCSGKSTWVRENAGSEDIVLDIDNIWECISNNDRYVKPKRLNAVVFGVRDCLLDMIRMRVGKWRNAYIIGGYPLSTDRDRLEQVIGIDEIVFIDEPKEVCLMRAMDRPGWNELIEKWFNDYTS